MSTVYGKLIALLMVLIAGMMLLSPMRFGREDALYAYPNSLRMKRGERFQLKVNLKSDENQSVSYLSVDETVAQVDGSGWVTAQAPGATEIHLRSEDGAKAAVKVTVEGVPTTRISLNTDNLVMEKGQATGLTAQFNEGAEDTRLQWKSENPEIASVDAAGRVTAIRGGETRISAVTPNGLRAETRVFVHVAGTAVRMTPENLTIGTGATLPIVPVWYPEDATDSVERWVSSDESLLSVDENGVIHARDIGQPVLTVYSEGGLSTSAIIRVEPSSEHIDLSPSIATIERGETLNLQTRFLDAEGNEDDSSEGHYLTWNSSDPEVATVEDGRVKALKSGRTDITATVDGMTAICALKVQVLVHEVTLNEHEIYMLKSATATPIQLIADIRPDDPDDPTITWTTSNDLVAKVDENGLVTMTGGYGTCTITARAASGAEDHCDISVVTELPEVDETTGQVSNS